MVNSYQDQTIVAQCTPIGNGALAIIRLSGKDAFEITDSFSKLSSQKKISSVGANTVHFGRIVNGNNVVDQVMFVVMHAPKTFTGEDVVEITCHNNQFIVEEIINLSIKNGARLAQNGEFAKRAFLNNKIDLVQAESINELIHASNQQSLKKSLSQLEGSFSNWITEIEKEILNCLVLSEASFEFLDDDEIEFKDNIKVKIDSTLEKINKLKLTHNDYNSIREGIRIAILGSVNAGKSSLFNFLIKKDRAIVTNIEGTTRDTIEAGIYKKDSYVTFVDTAGIRQTEDIVEKEGIKRSFLEAEKADIILLVLDGSVKLNKEASDFYLDLLNKFENKIILIQNKADLDSNNNLLNYLNAQIQKFEVSTSSQIGLSNLENYLDEKINEIINKYDSPFILNKRQYSLLIDLENKLTEMQNLLSGNLEYEILSIHLKESLESISDLTGKSISEAAMDAVFKEFCVGK